MLDAPLIILVVVLALVFDFINGFHDTANAIATCVSTRAIRPGLAIIGTAVLNFLGAMISTCRFKIHMLQKAERESLFVL